MAHTESYPQEQFLYINPLTDYGFKKVFGDEEIMREFLNDLLQLPSPIKHVNFLNKDILPENDELKAVIYDMRCETEAGGEVIVEMQNRGQAYFRDRILYYLAQSIAPQGWKGKKLNEVKTEEIGKLVMEAWDFNLKPVYGIFFLNFPLDGLSTRLVRTVRFMVEETREIFNDKIRAYTIELPCIKNKKESECKEAIEQWSYNLYNMETMNTQLPFSSEKPIFMRMAEVANFPQMSVEQQQVYMRSLNRYRTFMATKDYDLNRGIAIGRAEGLEEGMREGIQKGMKKGRQEGMQEGLMNSARLMIAAGADRTFVITTLKLTDEQIEQL